MFASDELLSSHSPLVGSLVCPVICCIQVLGLQVAVTAGWDGDPSGRLILGLLVPIGSISRKTGVVAAVEVGALGTLVTSLSHTSADIPVGLPVEIFVFLLSMAAKNCQVDAIASSLLTSLVLCFPHSTSRLGFHTCTQNIYICYV